MFGDDWSEREKLIWLAGVIDCEGSITCSTTRVRVAVTNARFELLRYIAANFGGKVYYRNARRAEDKWIAEWNIYYFPARNLADQLLPFLLLKREQAELLIKWVDETWSSSRGKEVTATKFSIRYKIEQQTRRLNKKGA